MTNIPTGNTPHIPLNSQQESAQQLPSGQPRTSFNMPARQAVPHSQTQRPSEDTKQETKRSDSSKSDKTEHEQKTEKKEEKKNDQAIAEREAKKPELDIGELSTDNLSEATGVDQQKQIDGISKAVAAVLKATVDKATLNPDGSLSLSLKNAANIPGGLQGAEMNIKTEGDKLIVKFDNVKAGAADLFSRDQKGLAQLVQSLEAMGHKNIEIKVGDQIIQLPKSEQLNVDKDGGGNQQKGGGQPQKEDREPDTKK
jgi:hypothetical protein